MNVFIACGLVVLGFFSVVSIIGLLIGFWRRVLHQWFRDGIWDTESPAILLSGITFGVASIIVGLLI